MKIPPVSPLADRQAVPPGRLCDRCRGEIYSGELYHCIDGFNICADCFLDFAFDYFAGCLTCCGTPTQEGDNHDA